MTKLFTYTYITKTDFLESKRFGLLSGSKKEKEQMKKYVSFYNKKEQKIDKAFDEKYGFFKFQDETYCFFRMNAFTLIRPMITMKQKKRVPINHECSK